MKGSNLQEIKKKNEMDSKTAITDCPERVPGSWCKEEIQMKTGDIPDVRRNQFLGRTRSS